MTTAISPLTSASKTIEVTVDGSSSYEQFVPWTWGVSGYQVPTKSTTDRKSKLAVDGRSSRLSGPILGQHPPPRHSTR